MRFILVKGNKLSIMIVIVILFFCIDYFDLKLFHSVCRMSHVYTKQYYIHRHTFGKRSYRIESTFDSVILLIQFHFRLLTYAENPKNRERSNAGTSFILRRSALYCKAYSLCQYKNNASTFPKPK